MDSHAPGLVNLLVLGGALFVIGLAGFLARRNLIVMLLSAELMLLGVAVTAVGFGHYQLNLHGQVIATFVLLAAAAEAALGLALAVPTFCWTGTPDADPGHGGELGR